MIAFAPTYSLGSINYHTNGSDLLKLLKEVLSLISIVFLELVYILLKIMKRKEKKKVIEACGMECKNYGMQS